MLETAFQVFIIRLETPDRTNQKSQLISQLAFKDCFTAFAMTARNMLLVAA